MSADCCWRVARVDASCDGVWIPRSVEGLDTAREFRRKRTAIGSCCSMRPRSMLELCSTMTMPMDVIPTMQSNQIMQVIRRGITLNQTGGSVASGARAGRLFFRLLMPCRCVEAFGRYGVFELSFRTRKVPKSSSSSELTGSLEEFRKIVFAVSGKSFSSPRDRNLPELWRRRLLGLVVVPLFSNED